MFFFSFFLLLHLLLLLLNTAKTYGSWEFQHRSGEEFPAPFGGGRPSAVRGGGSQHCSGKMVPALIGGGRPGAVRGSWGLSTVRSREAQRRSG